MRSILRSFEATINQLLRRAHLGRRWLYADVRCAAAVGWTGAPSDGLARRAFGIGLLVFVTASAACGLAPGMAALIAAQSAQGARAVLMMPSSMALIGS